MLSLALVVLVFVAAVQGQMPSNLTDILQVSGFMDESDFTFCYNNLVASDANNNSQVNRNEYVTFAKLMASDVLPNTTTEYNELPAAFRAAFIGTACLCLDPIFGGNPNNTDCCSLDNAAILIPPPPVSELPVDQKLYLYATCSYTSTAADAVRNETATAQPTPSPTPSPTTAPVTTAPSGTPVAVPVAVPSPAPSEAPVVAPTTASPVVVVPTSPVVAPVAPPTTLTPTFAPAPGVSVTANITYNISVANYQDDPIFTARYVADLRRSLNALAPVVVKSTFPSGVEFIWPTEIATLTNINCPSGTPSTSVCQTVLAKVDVQITDSSLDPAQVADQLEQALSKAIADGSLQATLNNINPNTPVTILVSTAPSPPSPTSEGLSAGATAGIVIGGLVLVLIPIAVFLYRRQRPPGDKTEYAPYDKDNDMSDDPPVGAPLGGGESDMDVRDSSLSDGDVYLDAKAGEVVSGAAMLGAAPADYGRASRKALEAMEAGEDIVAEPEMENDSSSNAGSSGWSSSAGISSLNTGSIDDSMDAAAAAGATLAAIGATSALTRKYDEKQKSKSALSGATPDESADASRSQLDSLIEAGDWAAVGATAALLAAASDSQSIGTGSSRASGSRDSNSLDAARAAELDRLVDAGDWEGVVLAAAKFEAAESSVAESRSTMEDSLDTKEGGATGEGTGTGTGEGTGTGTGGSPSISSTTQSDTASKVQRKAELRKEVEALVRRVVPEEIDNIDEMMNQFNGREEELVETLRTMQERTVAQKARSAQQKAAKTEARRTVQRGVVPGMEGVAERTAEGFQQQEGMTAGEMAALGTGALASAGIVAGAAATRREEAKEPEDAAPQSPSQALSDRRTALELAIESGDWEAVGEAAAMMSDVSIGSAADDVMSAGGASSASSLRNRSRLAGIEAERAAQLDQLIDRGDWAGVVEATKRFKEADAAKKVGRTKEEEEALAEAEAWMKIAEQSKKEGATDVGASDAAEWAIQRSLAQLKQAEKDQDRDKQEDDDEEEV